MNEIVWIKEGANMNLPTKMHKVIHKSKISSHFQDYKRNSKRKRGTLRQMHFEIRVNVERNGKLFINSPEGKNSLFIASHSYQ